VTAKRYTKSTLPQKICAACGRPFAWRKKWARDWEQVKTCSDRCKGEARERLPGLALRRWTSGGRPMVATFGIDDWPVEVFASPVEVERQAGWRHFVVERLLLELAGEALRQRVLGLRRAGARTEPAFAAALGLQGDPYAALYRLSLAPDGQLRELLVTAGFP
jgi:hypothetical protein